MRPEVDPSYTPVKPATTAQQGIVKKATALATSAVPSRTNSTGGSVVLTLPLITGAVYATDSGAIKNTLTTLGADVGSTNARLEELIANLKNAGVLA